MNYFKVVNWEKHQHYKDRTPPWIKIKNALLDHYEYGLLPDTSKFHLIGIWLLASRHDNKLPYNQEWIKQRIQATTKVNLDSLQDAGFIELYQDASVLLAGCKQSARLEGEVEREKEAEIEKRKTKDRWVKSFDRFWNAYLKRRGKEEAKKAWAKLAHEGIEIDTILTALEWQFRQEDWVKEKHQFAPNGATYLNNRRWEDEQTLQGTSNEPTGIDTLIRQAEEQEGKHGLLRISENS